VAGQVRLTRDGPVARIKAEPAAASRYAPRAEHREGIAAFLAKRKPAFRPQ